MGFQARFWLFKVREFFRGRGDGRRNRGRRMRIRGWGGGAQGANGGVWGGDSPPDPSGFNWFPPTRPVLLTHQKCTAFLMCLCQGGGMDSRSGPGITVGASLPTQPPSTGLRTGFESLSVSGPLAARGWIHAPPKADFQQGALSAGSGAGMTEWRVGWGHRVE